MTEVPPRPLGWRRSVGAKVTAVGFITLIIMGNFWLTRAILGMQPQPWLRLAFAFGVVAVACGGALLLARLACQVYTRFTED